MDRNFSVIDFLFNRGNYGFIDEYNMPKGYYKETLITDAKDFIVTGDNKDIANNHCGATAATNVSLYYLKDVNSRNVFKDLHRLIGNGPVFYISRKLKRYFKEQNKDLYYRKIKSSSQFKSAIDNGNIIIVLLAKGIINWHYAVCIGYRIYEDGQFFLITMDGWNKNIKKYYKINSGSLLLSATEYKVI